MAGKLALAAKLFLGTSVLAGGGAGAWYTTTHGWPSMADFARAGTATDVDSPAAPRAQTAPTTASDLDAVASAWAEPASTTSTNDSDSSPVARSAEPALAEPEKKLKEPPTGDRYAVTETPADSRAASAQVAPTDAVPTEIAPVEAEQNVAQLTPAIEQQPVAADDAKETAETTATPVARGQEPNDDSELQALTGDAASGNLQPLRTSNSKEQLSARADHPRDAFRGSAVVPAGDRYGAAASQNTTAAAADNKQGVVNPFATGSAGTQAAAQPTPANQAIEPLPGQPGDSEGRLTELPQTNDAQPLRGGGRFARAAQSETVGDLPATRSTTNRDIQRPSGFVGSPTPANENPPSNSLGASAEGEGSGRPGEKALEGPQKPALEIQKFAPGEIQVGKPAKFVVRVRNIGGQAAEGVVIRDEVPHGTKLVSTTPEAQNAGGHIVWELDKLSPGEDRTVEMQLMPVSEGEVGSVATVSYSAQASVKTKCTMPQLAIRMTAPAKVMIGQEQRVKIELRNPGSGDASGVMLFENVPQNVKHAAGPALEFEIGTLRAGETRELELVLMAEKAGKTVNVLSAKADGNLQVQQQVEFEVIAPGLTVDVAGPERRYLERPATYEVSVENPGTAPAHDVRIVTKLPKGLRFVRANNMGEYDAATHAVYWSLAELPEGEKGTVELVAMPIEAGPQTLEVESKAGQGLADQTQRQIMIDGLAAIMFEVKDLEDPIEVGGETGYEIRVVNQGTKAATNVQVAINLPPGMKLVSAEGETQHAEQRGAIVFEPLAQLAPKADTVFRIRAQGTAAGDQRVTVEVNTDDLAQPIRREESTLVFGDE
ncbi:MAG: hypothetical protein L0228_03535 [Planctomycetes bacterium]|nr:hypothetical protein [Planctomycetota bacterium]